jgi:glucose/arabinose dehydrogenase
MGMAPTIAKAQEPTLNYAPAIATGLTNPIDIVNAGDGSNRIFVVQRGGTIRCYNASLGFIRNFLTVTGIGSAGEGGLLSMAFHPDYETNGFFYVYYTLPDLSLEIARYQVSSSNPDSADAGSKLVVLNIPHPGNSNHNGGKLLFGTDGYLYLATGDGGGAGDVPNNAQNGNSLLGKMLRLNVTTSATAPFYTIPPTNPYISDPGVADEIWALGLRNPFRWSFDRTTGDMWIADVGQGAFEEINYRPAGATGGINYGWRCYEGNAAYNTTGCLPAASYTAPIFDYGHNNVTGGFSVTGGFVYRGPDYPTLNGYYICADYVSGNQWAIRSNGGGGWNVYQLTTTGFPGNIAAYGEAENGTLYAASLSGNAVYKVELSAILPLNLVSFTGTYQNNTGLLEWETEQEKDLDRFEVEYSSDGIRYAYAGTVTARSTASDYHFQHYYPMNGKLMYRLKMIDRDGQFRYSQIISVDALRGQASLIYPNVIRDGNLNLVPREGVNRLRIVNMNGSVLAQHNLAGRTGRLNIALEGLSTGMYWVHLEGEGTREVQKIIIQ